MQWDVKIAKRSLKRIKRIPGKDAQRLSFVLQSLSQNPYGGDIEKIGGKKMFGAAGWELGGFFMRYSPNKNLFSLKISEDVQIRHVAENNKIQPSQRAETLTLNDWLNLTKTLN